MNKILFFFLNKIPYMLVMTTTIDVGHWQNWS